MIDSNEQLPISFAVNDVVIKEDNCNLACEYCLTGQSIFKKGHDLKLIFEPPRRDSCLPGTELYERLKTVVNVSVERDIPVIKLSGGEVMLIQGMVEFIEEISACFETVVILTNGVLLNDNVLGRLLNLRNIVIQLSMDATDFYGNSYRIASEQMHNKYMQRVDRILLSGIPVELYMVINNRSIVSLPNTLNDLLSYEKADVTLYPFPLRGPDREKFLPKTEQHHYLMDVIDQAEIYGNLLPGSSYLNRLRRFFTEGKRNFSCHLPRIAFTTFDDGIVTSCPNIWFNTVGNILASPQKEVFDKLSTSAFRALLLSPRPRIEACQACFTPWDPVSLFFEKEIDIDELARVPMYRGERTKKRLIEIRQRLFGG